MRARIIGEASRGLRRILLTLVPLFFAVLMIQAQTDPGVRGGPAGAGGPIAGMSVQEEKFFSNGTTRFQQIESVSGTISGTGSGLGPTFNLDSCSGCHAQPAVGGTSPAENPQFPRANVAGPPNPFPFFVKTNVPFSEAPLNTY